MPYRVIQWATGAMGKTCLRAVIDHPDLELVGLYVHSPTKVGRDAGEIARRPPTGVVATDDIEAILALDADVVIHAPLLSRPYTGHDADVCRLLRSGKNVISINNYFHPPALGPDYAARLTEACRAGGASLCGTGLNPGWAGERIAAVASEICVDLDSLFIREVYDCSDMPNADYVFGVMGMGADPATLDLAASDFAHTFSQLYRQTIHWLGERMGLPIERVEADHSVVTAPEDLPVRAGLIRKGTVAATDWRLHGIAGGRRLITSSVNWIMHPGLKGYEGAAHWEIRLRGKPGLDIRIDLVEPADTTAKTRAVQYGVAGMVTSAIPAVVAAPPGLFAFPDVPGYRRRLPPRP